MFFPVGDQDVDISAWNEPEELTDHDPASLSDIDDVEVCLTGSNYVFLYACDVISESSVKQICLACACNSTFYMEIYKCNLIFVHWRKSPASFVANQAKLCRLMDIFTMRRRSV